MVLPLDLRQMTDQSGRVFVGRCDEVTQELDENGLPATYARLTVTEGIKGVETGETLLIKQFGAVRPPQDVREGESAILPMKTMTIGGGGYEAGRHYLLFLYPESTMGFTSPVGGGQGRFEVSDTAEGGAALTVVPPFGPAVLKSSSTGPVELNAMIRKVRNYLR